MRDANDTPEVDFKLFFSFLFSTRGSVKGVIVDAEISQIQKLFERAVWFICDQVDHGGYR